jgi:Flp pilus assembly secretin CpaC
MLPSLSRRFTLGISSVIMMMNKTKLTLFLSLIYMCASFAPATAQENTMDMPTVAKAGSTDTNDATHPILRLTQDKSEMVKLDQKAASVIVGNPNHISVLLDTPDTLVIVPRAPGASHFSVMGEDGSVIMQRHVIVGAAKEQYVRIRRSCGANDRGCQPTSVYFCPDMCHEVKENTQSVGRGR